MKKIRFILALVLAMTLLVTACGGDVTPPAEQGEDTGPSINYEDYITPVVDRKVSDLITAEELSAIMQVEVTPNIVTDASVTYLSSNGHYMVTISMENRTRDEFDAMVADTTLWTPQSGVGEVAYWGVDQSELVAYQGGYALSVYGVHVIPGCLQSIMLQTLKGLENQ